ncbi:hypothetical protein, partial [Geobacillus stearothermophilus]|uniref:hypothetical protein n=1 Tax=Geobacillus stearothermophilus TaxID=1422 RepID=UPI002E20EF45|nr:hypothetical protein [Geobacillus stearothermophilus]
RGGGGERRQGVNLKGGIVFRQSVWRPEAAMLPAAQVGVKRTMGVEENENGYKYSAIRADTNAGQRGMEVFRL